MNSNISSAKPFSQDVRKLATESDKKESAPMGEQVSELAHNKKANSIQAPISVTNKKLLNASILESALKFQGSVASQPQALLLKTALEGINEALKVLGVEKTVEQSSKEGIDVSPEATADRIVSFSTNFFPLYLKQHPEMDEQAALTKFVDVISGGINQGFSEAKEVLTGLNVLEGDIASNIEKTYELVQQGLSNFIDKYKPA
ncbi:DUF5610 domain-containing protein [Psychromonas sp. Urea-02u-13]|uniref:DUF5610 domain-containing protein n=1 Tax=Psychromonas sp. Urea-02u-13 TaxID=2058326 RepID=UPI000C343FEC|nr:DUF5610 domain-containing protein [Psychromonas sp. Urea-02u-13]PKG40826.1 hypothetical protein CXF74_01420 [Psychromonas sp. Urea-02u-13]